MAADDHFDANNIPTIDNVVWKPDESTNKCIGCGLPFDAFRRKHHCRACGDIFCQPCSKEKANIIGYREAQRVCSRCHKRMSKGFHEIKQVTESEAHNDEFLQLLQKRPGNKKCVDCGAANPTWVSISLGTLICLDCAGTHREFGVNVSFIQSLTLDTLKEEYKDPLLQGGNQAFHENVLLKLPPDVVMGGKYSKNPDKMYHVSIEIVCRAIGNE